MSGRCLVIDDDASGAEAVRSVLEPHGYEVQTETSPERGLHTLTNEGQFDLLLCDVHMNGLSGIEVCRRARAALPDLPVVLVTGGATLEMAIDAIRAGAFDFVLKPVDPRLLPVVVTRAVEHGRLRAEVKRLRREVNEAQGFEQILGKSQAMRQVFETIDRVAVTDATALITGESGTGKELVARAIHDRSARKNGPFVAINCAAVPPQLLESELFGHAKGAFTDAKNANRGLFLAADGGTLFLDEIGEMPAEMQAKLLRALQLRTVRPVGGSQEVPFDARLIAATNRDLRAEVNEHRFREDLFYRINVVSLELPPLRDRRGDAAMLAQRFVERFAARHKKPVVGISPEALERINAYQWPGNVRELENVIERAVVLARSDHLAVDDLPETVRAYRATAVPGLPYELEELVTVDELERRYTHHVLKLVRGNKSKAARILGYDRRTLYRKLERFDAPPGSQAAQPAGGDAADDERRNSEIPSTPPGPLGAADGGSLRVLVLDDDEDSVELLRILLEMRGHRVIGASTIEEAVAAMPSVDAVVADYRLGSGTAQVLPQRAGETPVICVSGEPAARVGDGFFAVLQKPVVIDQLLAELARAAKSRATVSVPPMPLAAVGAR